MLPDELRELARDAWEHRGDSYWWADHQWLMVAGLALLSGLIGFGFKWAELSLEARYRGRA